MIKYSNFSVFVYLSLLLSAYNTFSQTLEVEPRITPLVTALAKVENTSPSLLFGEMRVGFDGGLAIKYFTSHQWGIRAGIDVGVIDWNFNIAAPSVAFGSGRDIGTFHYHTNTDNFLYNALTLGVIYKIPYHNKFIEVSAGPSLRYYHGLGTISNDITINLSPDGQPIPPNISYIITESFSGFQVHLPIAVNYSVKSSPRSRILFGIATSLALNPFVKGKFNVRLSNNNYTGEFRPRSGYVGVDLRYAYSLKRSTK